MLAPAHFDLSVRPCRDLRRKLRRADKAGVTISNGATLPLDAMAEVDSLWQSSKGAARGGSMGRFCPEYLTRQRVYLAPHKGQLLGYISLHVSHGEWCLDLMRQLPDAPGGTMQKLIVCAIQDAAMCGVAGFSLACVPASAIRPPWQQKPDGLRQFKAGFAPKWHPRYAAAPGPVPLALALCDITRTIYHPPPLASTKQTHKEDEDCEVALHQAS